MGYPRFCPRMLPGGEDCTYLAPSILAFRCHLPIYHGVRLASRQRGHVATEFFISMSHDEARRQRIRLGNRQGGHGEIRRQLRQICISISVDTDGATPVAATLRTRRSIRRVHCDQLPPGRLSVRDSIVDLLGINYGVGP